MSKLQICNVALAVLGQRTITDLDDEQSQTVRLCKLFYDDARKTVLRGGTWSFATVVEPLLVIDYAIPGWPYLYEYPPNCLSILKIYSDGYDDPSGAPSCEFKVLQSPKPGEIVLAIATKAHHGWAEIISDCQNDALFDENFKEALSYKIAAMMAMPLTGDAAVAKSMIDIYQSSLRRALQLDAQQSFTVSQTRSSYLDAR